MAATTISRATWTDGVSGTVLANARLQGDIYDKIDSLIGSNINFGGTVGAEGFGTHLFSAGSSGSNILRIRNTSAGTSNLASLQVMADGADITQLEHLSSTTTTSGSALANVGRLRCSSGVGLHLDAAVYGVFIGNARKLTINSGDGLVLENNSGYKLLTSGGTTVDGITITGSNAINIGHDSATANLTIKCGAASMVFRTNGSDRLQITNAGQLYVGDGSASAPVWTFANDVNTGLYRVGADELGISTGGTLRTSWNSTGAMVHASAFRTSGVQSITLGAGDTNDLSLNADTVILLVTADASGSEINGITGGVAGRHLYVFNVSANALTWRADQIVDSNAVNCFRASESSTGASSGILSGYAQQFIYDATAVAGSGRWRGVL